MASWKDIILLLASGQGMLLALALFSRSRNRHRSNVFLGLIICIVSLELLNAWAIRLHYHNSDNAIPFWLLGSYLIVPPSLWLFIKCNVNAGFQYRKKYLALYIPALIEILAETIMFVRYKITGKPGHLLQVSGWYFFTEVLPVIWMGWVLFVYGKELRVLYSQRKINAKASTDVQVIKLYSLFVVFLLMCLLWAAEVLVQLPVFVVLEVVLVFFLFALAYTGYVQPAFFEAPIKITKKAPESRLFAAYTDEDELKRLTQIFEQQVLHTRPGLTVEEVAGELQLPVRYVSYLINTYHATNFHHYVNAYRVKEVIRKISDPDEKHKTLLALAFESGFNSKSTFNQVFKSHTGRSPSQYFK